MLIVGFRDRLDTRERVLVVGIGRHKAEKQTEEALKDLCRLLCLTRERKALDKGLRARLHMSGAISHKGGRLDARLLCALPELVEHGHGRARASDDIRLRRLRRATILLQTPRFRKR